MPDRSVSSVLAIRAVSGCHVLKVGGRPCRLRDLERMMKCAVEVRHTTAWGSGRAYGPSSARRCPYTPTPTGRARGAATNHQGLKLDRRKLGFDSLGASREEIGNRIGSGRSAARIRAEMPTTGMECPCAAEP